MPYFDDGKMKILLRILTDKGFLFVYYLLLVFIITLQQFLVHKYGNFIIFKDSNLHMLFHTDLYKLYPETKQDLFKYSPTFAWFFGVFRLLPEFPGFLIWQLLNAFILFIAIRSVPGMDDRAKGFILLAVSIELATSLGNSQSNGLVAGLLVTGFVMFENKQFLWGTLFIVCTVFIKVFGIAALVILFFYPEKKKIILYSLAWGLIMLLLPLSLVTPSYLAECYRSWFNSLGSDYARSAGTSVAGLLQSWTGMEVNKPLILMAGLVFLLLPLWVRRKSYDFSFRIRYFASLMIWIIIFNHKAESPSYIIAMTGIAIWFFSEEKKIVNIILFTLAMVTVSLTPMDIFPGTFRDNFLQPYCIKALLPVLIWFKVTRDMLMGKKKPGPLDPATSANIK